MDWVEGRLEALKDEDESEDDVTDKDQRGKAPARTRNDRTERAPASGGQRPPSASTRSTPSSSRMPPPSQTTDSKRGGRRSPERHDREEQQHRQRSGAHATTITTTSSSRHSSPSLSSPRSVSPTAKSINSHHSRKERERHSLSGSNILQNLQHYPFDFAIPSTPSRNSHLQGLGLITDPTTPGALPITVIESDNSTPTTGSKRRHTSIAGTESIPSMMTPTRTSVQSQSQGSVSRRRSRGGRQSTGASGGARNGDTGGGVTAMIGSGGAVMPYEPMEIEERARKVPRR